jgi:RNA polymerase sigma factor (sigma-70 family)
MSLKESTELRMTRERDDFLMSGSETQVVSDAAVIRRSLTEPESFAIVFDRHAPHIHRYLARRVGRQTADDLVAETFLTAFRKRDRYDTANPEARPWLYGIATNLVARHRRDEVRRYRLAKRAGSDPLAADHADRVLADLTSRSVRSVLCDALLGLTVADRNVLLLIACEELTYDEAARALYIPVGTVRSRMHRARLQLREALAETNATATYKEILGND